MKNEEWRRVEVGDWQACTSQIPPTLKSVSVREFYHNAGLVDGLPEGRQLIVTARGKPTFVVTKGVRPRMTPALAEPRVVGDAQSATVDGAAFLKSLKN